MADQQNDCIAAVLATEPEQVVPDFKIELDHLELKLQKIARILDDSRPGFVEYARGVVDQAMAIAKRAQAITSPTAARLTHLRLANAELVAACEKSVHQINELRCFVSSPVIQADLKQVGDCLRAAIAKHEANSPGANQ